MDRKRGREADGGMYGGGPAKRPYQGGRGAGGAYGAPAGGGSAAAASAGRLTTNDALSYLREVKTRFADNKRIYDEFLEIMKEFKASRVDTAGVIVRVKELFAGHRELILGFNTFLPKGYEIEMPLEDEPKKQPVEFDQAINYVNKIKNRFSDDERVYKAFLEILNMYRKGQKTITNVYEEVAQLFKSHSDLLEEFTYFLPDSTPPTQQQPKRPMGRGKPFGRMGAGGASNYPPKRKTRRGEDPDYIEEEGGFARTNLAKELTFFEKVKAKLRSREAYQDFLKCLNLYAQEVISKSELTHLVHDLIGRYSDLALGFNEFLTRCEMLDFDLDGKMASQGKMTIRDITRMKALSQQEKLATRPVSELDVTNWKRCTTSYVQLPDNYPELPCSGRRTQPQLSTLLNDLWVSVTSGSEDYSFKHMRKNQYEEALFRVEDDRFELDMMIETNASAMRTMANLARQLEDLDPEARARWLPPGPGERGALNAVHMRAVQRIYGEHGHQMVDLLKKNPTVAIPVLLARLVQKDSEWRESKKNMAPLWQKVYDANYHKSLDHRSFYFKQTDKRLLGAKGMVADIREIVERRRQADGGLAAVSAAADFSARLHADITYDYSARNVHEDVYVILRDSLKEMMTPDLAAKTLQLYTGLVEDFFGLPPRAPEPEPEPVVQEGGSEPSALKSPLKHKRLAMLQAEKDGADTDTDTGANDDERGGTPAPSDEAKEKTGADMLADAAAEADEAGASPAPRAGDANSGVSSDASPDAEKGDAEGPKAMEMDGGAAGKDDSDSAQSEHSSDDEGEEASQARYAGCKPLAPVARPPAATPPPGDGGDGAAAPEDKPEAPSRVFYGNEHYYVFFRLHQYLFDRLRVAHTCSHKKQGYLHGGGGANAEDQGKSPEEYRATHAKFMSLVHDLIVGTLDASQYEDACRALLGTGSYVLFTLEKLIYKVVKQLQTLVQDDLNYSLFQLYRYEVARGEPSKDATYFANAHVLLHDDTCFRFASLPLDRVSFQMMDPDKSEVPAGILEPSFASYLRSFTEQSAPQPDPAAKLFLLRNFPDGQAADPAAPPPAEGVELTNGLECKIATTTSKVSYVLDTEDVFRRHRRQQRQAPPDALARKVSKFRSWQDAARMQQLQQQQHQHQQPPPHLHFQAMVAA